MESQRMKRAREKSEAVEDPLPFDAAEMETAAEAIIHENRRRRNGLGAYFEGYPAWMLVIRPSGSASASVRGSWMLMSDVPRPTTKRLLVRLHSRDGEWEKQIPFTAPQEMQERSVRWVDTIERIARRTEKRLAKGKPPRAPQPEEILSGISQTVFRRVQAILDEMEEVGGPDDYAALMDAIKAETERRSDQHGAANPDSNDT